MEQISELAKFLYELGQLKRVKRSGWWMVGITNPESVAEHSFRTALLGYLLASLAEADPMKTAVMCLFHDAAEARVNDQHRVAKRYLQGGGEAQAREEQIRRLPSEVAQQVIDLMEDYEQGTSLEAQLAHDADKLECLLQGREYLAQGYADAEEWVTGSHASLHTQVAKDIADVCLDMEPRSWWQGLKQKREQPIRD